MQTKTIKKIRNLAFASGLVGIVLAFSCGKDSKKDEITIYQKLGLGLIASSGLYGLYLDKTLREKERSRYEPLDRNKYPWKLD